MTGETVRLIRVFVSSPGDVEPECNVLGEVVDSINQTDGQGSQFRLELFRWEDGVTPQIGPTPQQVVDSQTPAYEIYIGIMSTRFGTPTGRSGSGTEKEFKDALKNWRVAGAPWIAFYFDDQPRLSANPGDVEQYLQVCKFRKRMEKQGLYATYRGVRGSKDGFFEKVSVHLRRILSQLEEQSQPESQSADNQSSPTAMKPVLSKPSVPSRYTDWLLSRCGDVELMGLELKHGSGVRLNHVYTPLATSARADADEPLKRRSRKTQPSDVAELIGNEQDSTQLLLALLNGQSLIVSGAPGSGKSTFCRWVTWLTCNGRMPPVDVPAPKAYEENFPQKLKGRLPVLVRLRDFWQMLPPAGVHSVLFGALRLALERWLTAQQYPGLDWPCLQAHLDQGTALLMLDGVDEVPPVRKADFGEWHPRSVLIDSLAEAVARWTKTGNRVLLTSRPYGLNSEQRRKLGLTEASILNLDDELQALLVRRWFLRLKEDRDRGLETAEAMLAHIRDERGLNELSINPLLLTAMCIIYDEGSGFLTTNFCCTTVSSIRCCTNVTSARNTSKQFAGDSPPSRSECTPAMDSDSSEWHPKQRRPNAKLICCCRPINKWMDRQIRA